MLTLGSWVYTPTNQIGTLGVPMVNFPLLVEMTAYQSLKQETADVPAVDDVNQIRIYIYIYTL